MRDRFSIHIDNGQSENREAFTILRNGGQTSQSGLVGITNFNYADATDGLGLTEQPILPETIFNVQSSGQSDIRFSSGPDTRSSLELLGNGNTKASGLHFSYSPLLDDATIVHNVGASYPHIDAGASDNTVADLSLVRASGELGMEFSWLSVSEKGFIAIGNTRSHDTRHFNPNAPLTVGYYSDAVTDSGTISMLEQASNPSATADFGKLFVKPYTVGGRSQAIFFVDDTGNETNLVQSQELEPEDSTDGLIFGDIYFNTYGGWYTPAERHIDPQYQYNTFYGHSAGFNLITNPAIDGEVESNTLVGYSVGSGLLPGSRSNTVVGANSLVGFNNATKNIILGDSICHGGGSHGGMDNCIIIGRNLYSASVPDDGSLVIGLDSDPLITGVLTGSDRPFTLIDASLSIYGPGTNEFKHTNEYDGGNNKYINTIDIIDHTRGGTDHGKNNLEFNFSNSDGLSNTLFSLNPLSATLTNTPSYQSPIQTTPFAQLDADFKLRGAIRFQDGTSMSGLSYFDLVASDGVSGVRKTLENNINHFLLDFSDVPLAGNVSSNILTTNTFIATQLEGENSSKVGKMSLAGLADYVSSGVSSIGENCNILISNPESEVNVNMAANKNTTMIGCEVGQYASGWTQSVMLGMNAGSYATTPNLQLDIDTAAVFIGNLAGYDCDDVTNIIAIGSNAGRSATGSSESIYLGVNAGLDTRYDKSIGIGKHALRGSLIPTAGSGNIEIVCGKLDNQRLMYNAGIMSDRLNIQNTIAGRTDYRNLSIGDARLDPEAPLEVRRDSIIHGSNPEDYIQTWYCDDVLVASIDCDGNFTGNQSGGSGGAGSTIIEGIMAEDVAVATSISVPTSGKLTVYQNGVNTGNQIYVVNRDTSLTISTNDFVVAGTVDGGLTGGYRPLWVSC